MIVGMTHGKGFGPAPILGFTRFVIRKGDSDKSIPEQREARR